MVKIWILTAIFSAVFAGITAILAKCGIKKTDSDVATMLRTAIVLIFSWLIVFIVGSYKSIAAISGKSLLFLVLSGIATGASWLCYFKALSSGDVNKVAPADKSSAVLTVLSAIIIFGETEHIIIKLAGAVVLGIGIYLMIDKKAKTAKANKADGKWLVYAILSAVFAAAVSILAKVGISDVESDLGTAIRTGVVLVVSFFIVLAKGKSEQIKSVDKKELLFIILSGIATGASWLCYYHAIKYGQVSVVVPIDKMSILVTVIFSYIVFGEKLSKKSALGLFLMLTSTLAMAIFA